MKINNIKNFSPKLKLYYQESIRPPYLIFNDSDPIKKLISKMSEINLISKNTDFQFHLYYCNRNQIEIILYKEDEVIHLNNELIKNELTDYFIISLLIGNNPDIINYTFNIDLIKGIENQKKKENNKIYKKIIISKIVKELIKIYKVTDIYDEKDENELEQRELENNKIIEDNISIFKEIGLNLSIDDIKNKTIDKIYIDIIISLIKTNKFDDTEFTKDILEQLDIEKITITKKMFEELTKLLNSDELIKMVIFVDNYELVLLAIYINL